MNIHAQTNYSLDELLEGRSWHWRKSGSLQYWWYVAGTVFTSLGLLAFFVDDSPIAVMFTLYGIYCLCRKKILELRFKRNIRKAPGFGMIVEWTIGEEEIVQKSEIFSSNIKWDAIYETVTTPNGFLLYPQKNLFYWIPNSSFDHENDTAKMRSLLSAKTKNKSLLDR